MASSRKLSIINLGRIVMTFVSLYCPSPLVMLIPRCASPASSSKSPGMIASDAWPTASKLCGGLHPDWPTFIKARFLLSFVSYENIQLCSAISYASGTFTWLDLVGDNFCLTEERFGFDFHIYSSHI